MSNKPVSDINEWRNEEVIRIPVLQRFLANVANALQKGHNLSGVMSIRPRNNFTVIFILNGVELQYHIGIQGVLHRKDGYPELYVRTWFFYNADQTVCVELGAPREDLDNYAVLPNRVADAICEDYALRTLGEIGNQSVEF